MAIYEIKRKQQPQQTKTEGDNMSQIGTTNETRCEITKVSPVAYHDQAHREFLRLDDLVPYLNP